MMKLRPWTTRGRVAEEAQLEQRFRVAAIADREVDGRERGADQHHDGVEGGPAIDDSVAERDQQRAGGERHHQQGGGATATELRQHERREQNCGADQQADHQQRAPSRVMLWLTAYMSATAAGGAVRRPNVSRRRPCARFDSVRKRHADANAMRPIERDVEDQPPREVLHEPAAEHGPTAGARSIGIPKIPMTRPMFWVRPHA